jgi:hypothetical protein
VAVSLKVAAVAGAVNVRLPAQCSYAASAPRAVPVVVVVVVVRVAAGCPTAVERV